MYKSLIFLVICCCACKTEQTTVLVDPYEHIEDATVKAILKESITFYGGLDRWQKLKSLNYKKDFDLLLEDGSVEKSYKQEHQYSYRPTVVKISSLENGKAVVSTYKDDKYARSIDGITQNLAAPKIAKGINSSLYVIGQPYKLLDVGAKLSYLGERTMDNGVVVDVIQVTYDAERYDNHSSSEPWEYYFDKEERKIVANRITSSDHLNLVENLSFERINGFLFNSKRKSYRIDEEGNKLYLRATYHYYDYAVML